MGIALAAVAALALLVGAAILVGVAIGAEKLGLMKSWRTAVPVLGTTLLVLLSPAWYWLAGDKYFEWKCSRDSGVEILQKPLRIEHLVVSDDAVNHEVKDVAGQVVCSGDCPGLKRLALFKLRAAFESTQTKVIVIGDRGRSVKMWLAGADHANCVASLSHDFAGKCVAAEFRSTGVPEAAYRLVEQPFEKCDSESRCWPTAVTSLGLGVRRVEHHLIAPDGKVAARIVGFERGQPEFFWQTCPAERRTVGLPRALVNAVFAEAAGK